VAVCARRGASATTASRSTNCSPAEAAELIVCVSGVDAVFDPYPPCAGLEQLESIQETDGTDTRGRDHFVTFTYTCGAIRKQPHKVFVQSVDKVVIIDGHGWFIP
jgi:hypothetical protein